MPVMTRRDFLYQASTITAAAVGSTQALLAQARAQAKPLNLKICLLYTSPSPRD